MVVSRWQHGAAGASMLARSCGFPTNCGTAASVGRATSRWCAAPRRRLIPGRTLPAFSPGGSGDRTMRHQLPLPGTIRSWSKSSSRAGSPPDMCGQCSAGLRRSTRSNSVVAGSWEPSPPISWPLCTGRPVSPSVPAVRACTCPLALRGAPSVTSAGGAETTANRCVTPNETRGRACRRGVWRTKAGARLALRRR